MAVYVYRCPNGHEVEMAHGMTETVHVVCSVCGKVMARKPQPFRWYKNPFSVMLEKSEARFQYKRKKAQ